MLMTKIKTLRNKKTGEKYAPRTHVKAVYDDQGNTLDSLLGVQDEKLSELGSRVKDVTSEHEVVLGTTVSIKLDWAVKANQAFEIAVSSTDVTFSSNMIVLKDDKNVQIGNLFINEGYARFQLSYDVAFIKLERAEENVYTGGILKVSFISGVLLNSLDLKKDIIESNKQLNQRIDDIISENIQGAVDVVKGSDFRLEINHYFPQDKPIEINVSIDDSGTDYLILRDENFAPLKNISLNRINSYTPTKPLNKIYLTKNDIEIEGKLSYVITPINTYGIAESVVKKYTDPLYQYKELSNMTIFQSEVSVTNEGRLMHYFNSSVKKGDRVECVVLAPEGVGPAFILRKKNLETDNVVLPTVLPNTTYVFVATEDIDKFILTRNKITGDGTLSIILQVTRAMDIDYNMRWITSQANGKTPWIDRHEPESDVDNVNIDGYIYQQTDRVGNMLMGITDNGEFHFPLGLIMGNRVKYIHNGNLLSVNVMEKDGINYLIIG